MICEPKVTNNICDDVLEFLDNYCHKSDVIDNFSIFYEELPVNDDIDNFYEMPVNDSRDDEIYYERQLDPIDEYLQRMEYLDHLDLLRENDLDSSEIENESNTNKRVVEIDSESDDDSDDEL